MPALSTGRAAVLVVAGLAAVGLVAGLVVRDGDGDGERVVGQGPAAAEAFLDAWAASRAATYRLEADFDRTAPSGVHRGEHLIIVQRPPDRLTVDADSVAGLVAGRRLTCSFDAVHPAVCHDARARRTYQDDVDGQLETLGDYVLGDAVLYEVQARDDDVLGHCYELSLARQLPAPPLGTLATFCFDADVGAPTLTRVERPEAVDVTRTVQLDEVVTDTDLDPTTYDHAP